MSKRKIYCKEYGQWGWLHCKDHTDSLKASTHQQGMGAAAPLDCFPAYAVNCEPNGSERHNFHPLACKVGCDQPLKRLLHFLKPTGQIHILCLWVVNEAEWETAKTSYSCWHLLLSFKDFFFSAPSF